MLLMSPSHSACTSDPQHPRYTPTCAPAARVSCKRALPLRKPRPAVTARTGRTRRPGATLPGLSVRLARLHGARKQLILMPAWLQGTRRHLRLTLAWLQGARGQPSLMLAWPQGAGGRRQRTLSLPRSCFTSTPESTQASCVTSSSLRSCGSILCAPSPSPPVSTSAHALAALLPMHLSAHRQTPVKRCGALHSQPALHGACTANQSARRDEQALRRAELQEGPRAPTPASRARRRRSRQSSHTPAASQSAPACRAGRPATAGCSL